MNRYAALSQVQEIAATVEEGTKGRFVCPLCEGGSSKEKSLAISRENPVTAGFICFRASCTLGSGKVAIVQDGSGKIVRGKSKGTVVRKEPHMYPLTEEALNKLRNMNLVDHQIRYMNPRVTSDHRLVYPIFDTNRRRRGYVLRKYKDLYKGAREYSTIPKAYNHMTSDKSLPMSWYYYLRYPSKNSNILVLVEDIPSACRLIQYCDSCALLGTIPNMPKQLEIRGQAYDVIYLALDADASKKAVDIKDYCRASLPNMTVMLLEKDIKDMTPEELQEKMIHYEIANS